MFIIFVGCKSADKYPWRTLLSFLFPCRTRLGRSRPWHPESRAWAPLLQRQRGSGELRATSWRKHRGNDSNVMGRQRSSELVQNVQTLAFFTWTPHRWELLARCTCDTQSEWMLLCHWSLLVLPVQATRQLYTARTDGLCSLGGHSGGGPRLRLS